MRFLISLWIAKLAALAVNIIDKKRGTSLPGRIALRLMPQFTRNLSGINWEQVILVTGSNGKSTATNLLYQLLQNAYGNVVSANIEGANMLDGIATVFIKNANLKGKVKSDWFVFEADERSLPIIFKNMDVRNLAVTNIQMDQTYRNADPDFILRKIEPLISNNVRLFLCADEPCSLSLSQKSDQVYFYGLPKHAFSRKHASPYFQTRVCPSCGGKLDFSFYNASSMGPFACAQCDYKSPDKDVIRPSKINFDKSYFEFEGETYKANYNLPYHYYNYALALCFGKWLGVDPSVFHKTFEGFKNFDENSGAFSYMGKNITYIRFKQENPDTLQNALDRIASDKEPKALFIGLYPVRNALPYINDVTYSYSCDFEELKKAELEQIVIFSKSVADDTKLRLLYAGFSESDLCVMPTSDIDAILNKLDACESKKVYFITNRHTYELIYPKMKARMAQKGGQE